MWRLCTTALAAVLAAGIGLSSASSRASAQGSGGGRMGMGHDSATMAQMGVIHELISNHDRIRRTVTNLPDGIRTVTESDDSLLIQRIREHVASMNQRVGTGDDPALPIESAALRAIYRGKDKIHAVTEMTAKGVVVVQTSTDSAVVVALQEHAAEVSDFVQRGMVALHEAMMKNGGPMMRMRQGGMHSDTSAAAHSGHASGIADSAFVALQLRGEKAMGVDQYTSTHKFDALPDGGRIELQRDVDDTAGVAQIRAHLNEIVKAFEAGDFSTPAFVHMQQVPGTKVMAARRAAISYTYRDLPRGGELRIVTKDPEALEAIREFMAFQRQDHRAGGMDHRKPPD
jgi:hypothetical protein